MKLRITVEGKTYDVDVEVLEEGSRPPAPVAVATAPAPASAPVVAPAPSAPSPIAGANGQCVAPLPGTVVRVEVKVGDAVKRNQPVIVLDAMKMETPVPAPGDGKVKAIHANAGDSVKQGDLLVEFE